MKVGLDISQLAFGGGVATYTQNLADRLLKEKDLETVFFYSSLRLPYKGNLTNVKSFRLPPTITELLFNRLRLAPIENFIGSVDIFHSSDWVQPPTKAKKVTTYHDVVPLKFPQWSHPKVVNVHKKRLELVEREVDQVITVSQSTKKDLLEISKIPEDKITVIYEAVDEQFKPQPQTRVEEFRKRMKLPEKFILAIGGVGERRNLLRVKQASEGYNLIVTGDTIPFIPHNELPLLYCAADILLYPSFYEGFGLPILEAMACGVPVITSNISSMPEVGGEAAVYVDPLDVVKLKDKVREVVGDHDLREDLIKKGFTQVQKFSWEKCVKETVMIYKKLLNE